MKGRSQGPPHLEEAWAGCGGCRRCDPLGAPVGLRLEERAGPQGRPTATPDLRAPRPAILRGWGGGAPEPHGEREASPGRLHPAPPTPRPGLTLDPPGPGPAAAGEQEDNKGEEGGGSGRLRHSNRRRSPAAPSARARPRHLPLSLPPPARPRAPGSFAPRRHVSSREPVRPPPRAPPKGGAGRARAPALKGRVLVKGAEALASANLARRCGAEPRAGEAESSDRQSPSSLREVAEPAPAPALRPPAPNLRRVESRWVHRQGLQTRVFPRLPPAAARWTQLPVRASVFSKCS